MIRVGLRANECSVQSHVHLFEERVSQIVDWKNSIRCHQRRARGMRCVHFGAVQYQVLIFPLELIVDLFPITQFSPINRWTFEIDNLGKLEDEGSHEAKTVHYVVVVQDVVQDDLAFRRGLSNSLKGSRLMAASGNEMALNPTFQPDPSKRMVWGKRIL